MSEIVMVLDVVAEVVVPSSRITADAVPLTTAARLSQTYGANASTQNLAANNNSPRVRASG